MRIVCIALVLVSACNHSGESPQTQPTVSVAPPAPTASAKPTPPVPASGPGLGTWVGAPCAGRSYERVVTLGPENAIEITDRVSPCPPGAQCIWSGLVVRSGTFTVESPSALGKPSRLVLAIEEAESAKAQPLPQYFLWWDSRGELTEADESCGYVRSTGK